MLRGLWRRGLSATSLSAPPLDRMAASTVVPKATSYPKPKLSTSTLPNGVTVIAADRHTLAGHVTVYLNAGSRDEPSASPGLTHFWSTLAVQSTKTRFNPVRVVRDLTAVGASGSLILAALVNSVAAREYIGFSIDFAREDSAEALDVLADLVVNGQFHGWEIRDAAARYRDFNTKRAEGITDEIQNLAHLAAYRNHTLGKSLFASEATLSGVGADPEALKEWAQSLLSPKKIVVSAVDVDESALKKTVEKYFAPLTAPSSGLQSREKAVYIGGDIKVPTSPGDDVHLILAFEAPGVDSEQHIALAILNTLLGGGGSFSAGGPGKGMYSRLYRNVLMRYYFAHQANSFISLNSDSSLFGAYGVASAQDGDALASVLSTELKNLKKLTDVEVSRAKNQLISSLYMNLESRSLLAEDLGRSVLVHGKYIAPEELAAKINKVTTKDLENLASEILSSTPTVASMGGVSEIPPHHQFVSDFK